jgi:hypothetical protein
MLKEASVAYAFLICRDRNDFYLGLASISDKKKEQTTDISSNFAGVPRIPAKFSEQVGEN